ncbi:MAG TPA: hypothetical protein VMV22_09260 [Acidimicrobiales bacterium]|nr:hypothetical protein [Acidimicrobiales bacterium]
MTRRRPATARVARASAALCTTAVLAGVLSACAGYDAAALARQACQHVDRSLTLYRASLTTADPKAAAAEQSEALGQLRDALPMAATAAGEAGQYQGLMSTLAESAHLPESLLVHALSLQCAAAENGGAPLPGPTTTAQTPATRPPPTGR